ncbi:MAG: hypothetical protein IT459_05890 [Planctomycetes bacterium]|nr:hypothetical protein [Planctomycetota bacterium]
MSALRRAVYGIAMSLSCSASAALADDCAGDPGYVLSIVPNQVMIGTPFSTTIQAPAGELVILMYSSTPGPTPTAYGTLCIGLPLLGTAVFVMPPEDVSFPHYVDCNSQYVGFTGHVQFFAADLNQGTVHRSNSQTISLEPGSCPAGGFFPGDLATYTQGGWGQKCAGNNVGCLRNTHFASVFPNGLILGDEDGVDGDNAFALVLTSAAAVEALLPTGGKAGAFTADLTNPTTTSAGVFAGQLAAAKLNVAFDAAGKFDAKKVRDDLKVADMLYQAGVHLKLNGFSVLEVIDFADLAISGAVAMPMDVDGDTIGDVGFSDLSQALDMFNNNFDKANQNLGVLTSP